MGQASADGRLLTHNTHPHTHIHTPQINTTRLTNGFSKKAENHAYAVALHMVHYNFCRVHGTLTKRNKGIHTTPAMEAGLADRVYKMSDLVLSLT